MKSYLLHVKELVLRIPKIFLVSQSEYFITFKSLLEPISPLVKVNYSSSFFADIFIWSDVTLRIDWRLAVNVRCLFFGGLDRRIIRGANIDPLPQKVLLPSKKIPWIWLISQLLMSQRLSFWIWNSRNLFSVNSKLGSSSFRIPSSTVTFSVLSSNIHKLKYVQYKAQRQICGT